MDRINWDWLDTQWLTPAVLKSFDWGSTLLMYPILDLPLLIYLILSTPLLYVMRWFLYIRFQQKFAIALPETHLKQDLTALLRFIPPALMVGAIAFFLIALARPQKTDERVEQWTEGIDIMLVLDISESMQIEDFTPNRLEAAKQVARNFIAGRFRDRIGMVIFSGEAISYAPLTTDYELLNSLINDIDFEMIDKGGTAIGSALAVGINRMRDSETKSKVLILLSDGENTAGNIDPVTSANLAYAYGIKVYTIGVGKEGKVPFGTDIFGRTRYIEQSLDERVLREIAKIGKGQYFRATNNRALKQIFERIDKYEKAEIKENRYKDTQDFYHIYLIYGILLLLLWLFCKSTFLNNILED